MRQHAASISLKYFSSQIIEGRSRLLVGSSNKRTFGLANNKAIKATLVFCPPLKEATALSGEMLFRLNPSSIASKR